MSKEETKGKIEKTKGKIREEVGKMTDNKITKRRNTHFSNNSFFYPTVVRKLEAP